ncbi:MAG: uracil-DNA glycosylase [Methanocorpusculum sp.]|nr:uracil-DNA glycosylase [Methanocorpusculum sp.]
MNIKDELIKSVGAAEDIRLNDVEMNPLNVKAVMINEVVPFDSSNDFYGGANADYMKTTIPLFQNAGLLVYSIDDILNLGIYITNAVKIPKTESAVDKSCIEKSLPYLEKELSLFPNVRVIMLMGDVAKKSFNMISKKASKKNAVPAVSTYKLRGSEIFYRDMRIMPSYIMTGGNLLIEKSKSLMTSEDIAVMAELIK